MSSFAWTSTTLSKMRLMPRVQSFFTEWINGEYHGSDLEFTIKEAPQQNDKTSCGIFALEIMRRLLSSEDMKQPIEPMEVRRALLQRTTSIDTSRPDLNESTRGTLRFIQKYSPIRAMIDKISAAAGPKKASFANLLPYAEEEIARTTDEINERELKHKLAKDRLSDLKTELEITKKNYANLLDFIAADETADSPIALLPGMRGDEQGVDDSREPSAKKPRISREATVQAISNVMFQYTNSKTQESMDKILDGVRKSVEKAEKEEREIAEQLDRLRRQAVRANMLTSVYRGFSDIQNNGVDARVVVSYIMRQA